MDIQKIRGQFPTLVDASRRPYVFLDTAASSLTPRPVIEAMGRFYTDFRANVHRGMYTDSLRATEAYEAARSKVAGFIGAEAEEIVFTRGATESLNVAARGLAEGLGPGDEVVITIMEHHANLIPWQQLADRSGFTLRFLPLGEDFRLDMEAARQTIGPRTKVVAFMAVSNVLGTVNPTEELIALAKAQGAATVIDVAQAAGHLPLDVTSWDCDFLALSGHKMYGPTGIGILYGKRPRLEAMEPQTFGGDMILEVTKERSTWNRIPWKFEAGTPHIAGAIGLAAAIGFVEEIGIEEVVRAEERLAAHALERLQSVPGLRLYGPAGGVRGGALSFAVDDIHPHDMADLLSKQGICVRGGHHCAMPLMRELGIVGTTRASLGIYNTEQDIEDLIQAIHEAKRIFG
ncbi:cysteine desulfurase [Parcubacteria bacterium SG8_24]|nr:MAG: cysteine desulfurase [Parcubacteria bacterium SG8_24]